MEAFQVVSRQKNKALSKMVVDVYKLAEGNDKFLTPLKEMLKYHLYKEACEWSVLLELQDHFSVNDFLIPLMLQDKLSVIDDFLKASPRHQIEFVKCLDDILGEKNMSNHLDKIIHELDIPSVHHNTLLKLNQPRGLGKFIKRLVATYNITSDVTPNQSRRTSYSTISYLVHRRYIDKNLNKEAFRELIYDACGSDRDFWWHVIQKVSQAGDAKEGLYWCRQLDIQREEMPGMVRQLYDQGWNEEDEASSSNATESGEFDCWDMDFSNDYFYRLVLPPSSIVIVDTEGGLASLVECGLAGVSRVGIDSEWKPVLNRSRSELALLQIATPDKVYLVDVIALAPFKHLWHELGLILFANQDVVKLGFSLNHDMSMLSRYIELSDANLSGPGYLDLASVWSKLVSDFNFRFPFEALDAYCLLEIYSALERICSENAIPFDEVVRDVMVGSWKQGKSKKKSIGVVKDHKEKIVINEEPVRVEHLKVACDAMLVGLGKQLRRCGVDSVLIPPQSPLDHYISCAVDESRIILTKGNSYRKLCNGKEMMTVDSVKMSEILNINSRQASKVMYPAGYLEENEDCDYFSEEEEEEDYWEPQIKICDKPFITNRSGSKVEVQGVPYEILTRVSEIYICETCGSSYWDDGHFDRVLGSLGSLEVLERL
ncbi:hypothetical protein AAG570_004286 [Ranatra chinensis]|uniref:3'-5' exonuclease domain-containing protein n=1 Tax=Ranatra chinensis TaxID=642074 RepID=A0ABD0YD30_9HEMI